MKSSSEEFSRRLSAKRRWLYFDVKTQDDGSRFLSISEVLKRDDADRHRIIVDERDIEEFAKCIEEVKQYLHGREKAYTVAEVRTEHRNAYRSWAPEEDERLIDAYQAGRTLNELATVFGRTPGAIESRLKRLGVDA